MLTMRNTTNTYIMTTHVMSRVYNLMVLRGLMSHNNVEHRFKSFSPTYRFCFRIDKKYKLDQASKSQCITTIPQAFLNI